MKKILSIIGTRPQFIKLYPICKAIEEFNKGANRINHVIINTGQHFDKLMSDVFISELKINKPSYNLGVKEDTQLTQVGKMILKLEEVLLKENPGIVLVYGDTNSTLAGALATKKLNFKIAHIEAGLRSFNRNMQEEINRIIVDKISDILFCPTKNAYENLKDEGFLLERSKYKVYLVGDVMYDCFLFFKDMALSKSKILEEIFGKNRERYILVTIHRAENTDDFFRLSKILELLNELSNKYFIVFPVHPRTKKYIENIDFKKSKKLKMIEPVSYFDMIVLEKNSDFIITDSGGVQKEAYFLKRPCLTLRKETEWIETLERNCNFLVNLNYKRILNILKNFVNKSSFIDGLYGVGRASEDVVKFLYKYCE